jgi:hypothetical protein
MIPRTREETGAESLRRVRIFVQDLEEFIEKGLFFSETDSGTEHIIFKANEGANCQYINCGVCVMDSCRNMTTRIKIATGVEIAMRTGGAVSVNKTEGAQVALEMLVSELKKRINERVLYSPYRIKNAWNAGVRSKPIKDTRYSCVHGYYTDEKMPGCYHKTSECSVRKHGRRV